MKPSLQKVRNVSVVGAGAWGTTLARHLAQKGLSVNLWAFEPKTVESIKATRQNSLYLPGVSLPENIQPSSELSVVIQNAELLILTVPSHAMRTTIESLFPFVTRPIPTVIATKGIEEGSCKLMSQVISDIVPEEWSPFLSVLSGPSFATEVCAGKPTTILLAGQNFDLITHLQSLLMATYFRVYTAKDIIGAQLGGALKNVMAIAAGIVDGLDLGLNARAALITRGLAEMIRLGLAMGADVQTLYGLSGLGDLVLTCTGSLSRNYTVGFKLGRGQTLEECLKDTATVAEGVRTAHAAVGLANRVHVTMPIAEGICDILFEGRAPQETVAQLMKRAARAESDSTIVSRRPCSTPPPSA